MTTTLNDTLETLGRKAAETVLQTPIRIRSPEEAEERLAQINREIADSFAKIDKHVMQYDARLARLAALEQQTAPVSPSAGTSSYTDGLSMSRQEAYACLADIEIKLARLPALDRAESVLGTLNHQFEVLGELFSPLVKAIGSSEVAPMQGDIILQTAAPSAVYQEPATPATLHSLSEPGNVSGDYPAVTKITSFKHRLRRVLRKAVTPVAAFVLGLGVYGALSDDEAAEPPYDAARAHIHSAASLGESRTLRQRIEQEISRSEALPGEQEISSSNYSRISIATPEEALAQYNAFLESVSGELVVSVRQYRAFAEARGEQVTEADICREALGELYRAMAFREIDALDEQRFADMLRGLCTDVAVDAEHYRFVPYNGRGLQTGEDR